ncbi:MAG: terpene cyclase/mutase family protein [Verrucomicrobiaceae bacterium]|nr:terpene cyclase/mutase family protein [Verrucomicrobiaceae bacterium]
MKTIPVILACGICLAGFASAQDAATRLRNESIKREVEHAVSRSVEFLVKQQKEDGRWGEENYPALTGLVLQAMLGDPSREGIALPDHVEKGLDYIRSKVRLDGGIYGKGLGSYNTSICMMALLAAGQEEDKKIITNARKFLVNQQSDFDRKGETDNVFDGGVGYGSSYSHPDLSNTYHALEALHYTRDLVKEAPDKAFDLDWEAAINFVANCQQRPSSNKAEWVSKDAKDQGGFVYFPGKSMSTEETADGKIALRSYGSMSYAGLLSFVYAKMEKDDPRLTAVFNWLKKNYSVDQNPGMGEQGLFYYYNTMSKALNILEVESFELANGSKVNWREDLTKKLFNLQKPDGSWMNENGRWWEKDPVLTSCYALLCLERMHAGL